VRAPLAVLATLLALAAPAAADVMRPAEPIGHAGRWMTDGSGRVLVVHGVNVPSKLLPAYPAALDFGDDDAALLASLGLDAVRLTVERYAVEPKAGRFDDAYLAHVADTVRLLWRHGIASLVDFHQDEYGPVFYDNGFPDWMTMTDGLPNLFEVGFPAQYVANPALNRAFDHFWADDTGPSGRPLQADDAAIESHVAAALSGEAGILGYEAINEPWPGTQYPACFNPAIGCPTFDTGPLSAYYARVLPALRRADPRRLAFYEPLVSFNYGVPTSVVPPKDAGVGFAFHDYPACSAADDAGLPVPAPAQGCAAEDGAVLDNAVSHAAATGDALLETEFGSSADTQRVGDQLARYDAQMIPWMFWSYTRFVDALAPDGTLRPATPANVDAAMAATLARPYPELVAGTPQGWSFDPSAKAFSASWSTRRAGGAGRFPAGARTVIVVPAVQYPHGYTARVAGGRVVSRPGAGLLVIAQDAGASQVSVAVASAT